MKTTIVVAAFSVCFAWSASAAPNADTRNNNPRMNNPRAKSEEAKTEAKRAFRRADKDDDGKLTKDEFSKAAPSNAPESFVTKRFNFLDHNKDSEISAEEFQAWDEKALKNELEREKARQKELERAGKSTEKADPATPASPPKDNPPRRPRKPEGPPAAE